MKIKFNPQGVCSKCMSIEIEDDKIKSVDIIGGCDGNLKGIKKLLVGMEAEEVISKLKGICCHTKDTSCPDQLARGLEKAIREV